MRRTVVFIYLSVFISSININAQYVSVKGVIHADTVQINTPFSLSFYFVNSGLDTLFMDSITANIVISSLGVTTIPIQISYLLKLHWNQLIFDYYLWIDVIFLMLL